MTVTFPDNPTLNESYDAENGLTYIWDGEKWSSQSAYNVDNDVFIAQDGSNTAIFADDDSVGIGTTSPTTALDIRVPSIANNTSQNAINLQDGGTSSAGITLDRYQNSQNYGISFYTSAGSAREKVRITNTGNVGIGTENPSTMLELSGEGATAVLRITDTDTALSDGENSGRIEFYQSDASGPGVGASITTLGDGSTGSLQMRFNTGSDNEAMRISSGGRVGIGTGTDMSTKLNILRDGNFDRTVANDAGIFVRTTNATTGDGKYGNGICFSKINSARPGSAITSVQTTGDPDRLGIGFFTHSSSTTNNTLAEAFRIKHDGGLFGLDTTISSLSDERLKENIEDFEYSLESFKQFQPKSFSWKLPENHGGRETQIGFIAQDVEGIDSEWVDEMVINEDHTDVQHLDEDRVAKTSALGRKDAMYVSVINQLISKVESLEARLSELEGN